MSNNAITLHYITKMAPSNLIIDAEAMIIISLILHLLIHQDKDNLKIVYLLFIWVTEF